MSSAGAEGITQSRKAAKARRCSAVGQPFGTAATWSKLPQRLLCCPGLYPDRRWNDMPYGYRSDLLCLFMEDVRHLLKPPAPIKPVQQGTNEEISDD